LKYKNNWIQQVDRIQRDRNPKLLKKSTSTRTKEPRKTSKETSGRLRPEQGSNCVMLDNENEYKIK
jgi:hypothetical protein